MARLCFDSSNAFRRSMAFLSFFVGLLFGPLRGDSDGEKSLSSSFTERSLFLRGDLRDLVGEYCSFQSLITSVLQNASILGRCGDGGTRSLFEGDCSLDLGGPKGGVTGLTPSAILYGDFNLGGELPRC